MLQDQLREGFQDMMQSTCLAGLGLMPTSTRTQGLTPQQGYVHMEGILSDILLTRCVVSSLTGNGQQTQGEKHIKLCWYLSLDLKKQDGGIVYRLLSLFPLPISLSLMHEPVCLFPPSTFLALPSLFFSQSGQTDARR